MPRLTRTWHNRTPTKRQIRAAFDAQAPHDMPATEPKRKPRRKWKEDDLSELGEDGVKLPE